MPPVCQLPGRPETYNPRKVYYRVRLRPLTAQGGAHRTRLGHVSLGEVKSGWAKKPNRLSPHTGGYPPRSLISSAQQLRGQQGTDVARSSRYKDMLSCHSCCHPGAKSPFRPTISSTGALLSVVNGDTLFQAGKPANIGYITFPRMATSRLTGGLYLFQMLSDVLARYFDKAGTAAQYNQL